MPLKIIEKFMPPRKVKISIAARARIIILLACILCTPVFAEEIKEGNSLKLSLQDAVNLAFKNNKGLRMQEQEVEATKAEIRQAQSLFLPRLNLNAGYDHNSDVLTFPSPGSKKDARIFTGYKNENKAGLSVEQSIFKGGANIANFKQAQLQLKFQEQILRLRKLDVEFEVKRLYYGLLLAYDTERITRDLLEQAQAHYRQVQDKYQQGTASRFELLQSKVQVSKITPQVIKAENASELILVELKKILGVKMDYSLSISGRLEYTRIEPKEGEALVQAYLTNPQMILEGLGVDRSRVSIELARAENRPQIEAGFNYNYKSNDLSDMFNNRHNLWNAGFSVRIPVFDGFSSKAKVDAAKARYQQSILGKEDLAEQIALDIRRACLDLKQAQALIDSQKDNIEEAKEALKISEVSYQSGEGTNLDVLDAQVSLSQVEKNLGEGIYDYLMAQAYFERTIGNTIAGEAGDDKKN